MIVCEVDAVEGLRAAMDGYQVMTIAQAAAVGQVFVTVTGDIHVIREEHFDVMRDGAILCNAGHFDVEIDLMALAEMAVDVRGCATKRWSTASWMAGVCMCLGRGGW